MSALHLYIQSAFASMPCELYIIFGGNQFGYRVCAYFHSLNVSGRLTVLTSIIDKVFLGMCLESCPFYIHVVFSLPYLHLRKLFIGHRNVPTYWLKTWPPSEHFFQCLFDCYKLHLLFSIDLFISVSFLKVHKLVSWYRLIKGLCSVFC